MSNQSGLAGKIITGLDDVWVAIQNILTGLNNYVLKSGDTMTGTLTAPVVFASTSLVTPTLRGDIWNTQDNGYILIDGGASVGGTTKIVISKTTHVLFPVQAPTASAPSYVKGGLYFDTTLNKLRVGGATAWETVTSA